MEKYAQIVLVLVLPPKNQVDLLEQYFYEDYHFYVTSLYLYIAPLQALTPLYGNSYIKCATPLYGNSTIKGASKVIIRLY